MKRFGGHLSTYVCVFAPEDKAVIGAHMKDDRLDHRSSQMSQGSCSRRLTSCQYRQYTANWNCALRPTMICSSVFLRGCEVRCKG